MRQARELWRHMRLRRAVSLQLVSSCRSNSACPHLLILRLYVTLLIWCYFFLWITRRSLRSTKVHTADERLKRQTTRNKLWQRILDWRRIQVIYMPIVSTLLPPPSTDSDAPTPIPEDEKLWMPCDVDEKQHATGLASGLAELELRLRESEAQDTLHQACFLYLLSTYVRLLMCSLSQLRRHIRIRMGLVHFKQNQGSGRGGKNITRAQSAINGVTSKIEKWAERYRAARRALMVLDPIAFKEASREDPKVGKWTMVYRELLKADILNPRGEDPGDAPPVTPAERRKAALGEGHKTIPWIWTTVRYTAADDIHPTRTTDEEAIEGKHSSTD